MTIRLNSNLPAFTDLKNEGVPVLDATKADKQSIRPLNIGFLNLMPSAAFQGTERQWLRLLGRTPLQINPVLIDFDDKQLRTTAGEGKDHLAQHYKPFSEIQKSGLDGLIVTGSNTEYVPDSNIAYLSALHDIMDWAQEQVTSTIYSCKASHTAAKHFYNIQRTLVSERRKKLLGVFSHEVVNSEHPLCRSLDDQFDVPHARCGNLPIEAIDLEEDLLILIKSVEERVGFHVAASKDLRTVLMQGHGEYDRMDLHNEYLRDKGSENESKIPENYYRKEETELVIMNWRANSQTLVSNWVNYIYQTTGFDPLKPTMDLVDETT